ncbi:hypothetical protein cyc_08853 [Cyclospora cayetanensis]|uniref:Uncharacterized protein n=1 Tax=Cyclospora cayetanensis TaxID=88456 RepID=A0A1D3CW02_9EIME|nr:hypothetical protein cyc_08853 [Cyclospora cayetanensis]
MARALLPQRRSCTFAVASLHRLQEGLFVFQTKEEAASPMRGIHQREDSVSVHKQLHSKVLMKALSEMAIVAWRFASGVRGLQLQALKDAFFGSVFGGDGRADDILALFFPCSTAGDFWVEAAEEQRGGGIYERNREKIDEGLLFRQWMALPSKALTRSGWDAKHMCLGICLGKVLDDGNIRLAVLQQNHVSMQLEWLSENAARGLPRRGILTAAHARYASKLADIAPSEQRSANLAVLGSVARP